MGNAVEARPDDPTPEPKAPVEKKAPEPEPEHDDFHEDPLIQEAMRIFEGKLKS